MTEIIALKLACLSVRHENCRLRHTGVDSLGFLNVYVTVKTALDSLILSAEIFLLSFSFDVIVEKQSLSFSYTGILCSVRLRTGETAFLVCRILIYRISVSCYTVIIYTSSFFSLFSHFLIFCALKHFFVCKALLLAGRT